MSEEVNGKLPARNTTVQLPTHYTDPERHNAHAESETDRVDRQYQEPRADHTARGEDEIITVREGKDVATCCYGIVVM